MLHVHVYLHTANTQLRESQCVSENNKLHVSLKKNPLHIPINYYGHRNALYACNHSLRYVRHASEYVYNKYQGLWLHCYIPTPIIHIATTQVVQNGLGNRRLTKNFRYDNSIWIQLSTNTCRCTCTTGVHLITPVGNSHILTRTTHEMGRPKDMQMHTVKGHPQLVSRQQSGGYLATTVNWVSLVGS